MPVAAAWVSVERPMVRLPPVCAHWHLMNVHEPKKINDDGRQVQPVANRDRERLYHATATVAEQAAANAWRTLAILTLLA
jgi:hypothetical protein